VLTNRNLDVVFAHNIANENLELIYYKVIKRQNHGNAELPYTPSKISPQKKLFKNCSLEVTTPN
jgi:hypothetical protein